MPTGFWEKLPRLIMALAPMADVTDAAFRAIMVRAIKEKIEKIIADKIIAGTVRTGDTVELTKSELA